MANTKALETVKRVTAASYAATMTFPEIVGALGEIGVVIYHVDFLRSEKTCYFHDGDSIVESVELAPDAIADAFDKAEMAADVKASQNEKQPYRTFVARARRAGCIGYFVYLEGRKVVYLGWRGDEHVELFPGSP